MEQQEELTCASPIDDLQKMCDQHDQKMSPASASAPVVIGQGTYGRVEVCPLDQNVVVKTSAMSCAFLNEVGTLQRLQGVPGVPKYHGFQITTTGAAQLFLERYPMNLTSFLNQVPDSTVFLPTIVRQLTLIVAACHVRGVAHSDISLNNILVRPLYTVKASSAAAVTDCDCLPESKPSFSSGSSSFPSGSSLPSMCDDEDGDDEKKQADRRTSDLPHAEPKVSSLDRKIADLEIALCDFGCSHMFFGNGGEIVSIADQVTTSPWRAPEISEQEKSPELRFTPKIDVFSMGMIFFDILFWKALSIQTINNRHCKDDIKAILQNLKNAETKIDPHLASFLPLLLEPNPQKRITANHLLFDAHFQQYCGIKADFVTFPLRSNWDPFAFHHQQNRNTKDANVLRIVTEKLCASIFDQCKLGFFGKETRNMIQIQVRSMIRNYEQRKKIDPQLLTVFVCCACVLACAHQCIQPSLESIKQLFFHPSTPLTLFDSVLYDLFCTLDGNIFM